MKARTTEINIWAGNLQEGFSAAAPSWVSARVNLQGDGWFGNGHVLKKNLVSLGQVCPQSRATLRCPWSIPDLLQLWPWSLWLRTVMQAWTFFHLWQCTKPGPPALMQFWLTDPAVLDVLQLVWSPLWLFLWALSCLGWLQPPLTGLPSLATLPQCLCFPPAPSPPGTWTPALLPWVLVPQPPCWGWRSPEDVPDLWQPLCEDRAAMWSPQTSAYPGSAGGECCSSCGCRKLAGWC